MFEWHDTKHTHIIIIFKKFEFIWTRIFWENATFCFILFCQYCDFEVKSRSAKLAQTGKAQPSEMTNMQHLSTYSFCYHTKAKFKRSCTSSGQEISPTWRCLPLKVVWLPSLTFSWSNTDYYKDSIISSPFLLSFWVTPLLQPYIIHTSTHTLWVLLTEKSI